MITAEVEAEPPPAEPPPPPPKESCQHCGCPITACRSCGAPIVWALTEQGKRMPLDALVTTVMAMFNESGPITVANIATADEISWRQVKGHVSHFATCPQADRWRKG